MAAEVTAGTGQAMDRKKWLPRQAHALSPSLERERSPGGRPEGLCKIAWRKRDGLGVGEAKSTT